MERSKFDPKPAHQTEPALKKGTDNPSPAPQQTSPQTAKPLNALPTLDGAKQVRSQAQSTDRARTQGALLRAATCEASFARGPFTSNARSAPGPNLGNHG